MPAPVGWVSAAPTPVGPGGAASVEKGDFAGVLKQAIERVEGLRREADAGVMKLLAGENEEVHQTVLAVQKAELAFELFMEIRNKVVQAYQEIMRMPI